MKTIDLAVADARAHATGGEPVSALAELRALIDDLSADRRGLPLIVSLGRLQPVKGMATLVRAWAGSPLQRRANLLIIGGNLERPSVDERHQLELIEHVVPSAERSAAGLLLPGHRANDIALRWLAAARLGLRDLVAPGGVYACASVKEEFGIALLEAMATGLLVVAPDAGGPATYVEDGVTGFLAATSDVRRLRAALDKALTAAGGPDGSARSEEHAHATARLITSTEPMMMITELEKPSKAFFAGTTPVRTAADSAKAATRSYRNRSDTNSTSMPATIAKASICGRVKCAAS